MTTTLAAGRTLLPDDAASGALGAALAERTLERFAASGPTGGFTIHFSGELGAGKTTVVRALLRRLGVTGRIKSPTFTLVESYVVELPTPVESRCSVNLYCHHFDFYRFEDPREWLSAGFRDHFSDAALRLVEWPERARGDDGSLLPPPDVQIVLGYDGAGRVADVVAGTDTGVAWLTPARDGRSSVAGAS